MIYRSTEYSLLDQNGQRKYLNQKERNNFYIVAKNQSKEIRLICELLYWTGARISEVLHLSKRSLDINEGSVTIESLKKRKKGIFRQIPLPPEYMESLINYMNERKLEDRIWKFSRHTASRYIKKAMLKATVFWTNGMSKRIAPQFCSKLFS